MSQGKIPQCQYPLQWDLLNLITYNTVLICWKMGSMGAQLISTEKLKGLHTNLYHLGNEKHRNKRLLGSLTTLPHDHNQIV